MSTREVIKYSKSDDEDVRRKAAKAVIELRSEDPPKTYKECARIVLDELAIKLTRNNIYNIIKNNREREKERKSRPEPQEGETIPYSDLNERAKSEVREVVISIRSSRDRVKYRDIVEEVKCKMSIELKKEDIDAILLRRVEKLERSRQQREVTRREKVRKKKRERKPAEVRNLVVNTSAGEKEVEYKVCNVVFSGTIDAAIDIPTFVERNQDAVYDPKKFPGIVIKLHDPVASMLVFKTGKWVCVGLNDADEIGRVKGELHRRILRSGIDLPEDGIDYDVKNIVLTTSLPDDTERVADLNLLALQLECCMYEPEVFPGLIYKDRAEGGSGRQRAVFLIFSSKKVVCVGIRNPEGIEEILSDFTRSIAALGDSIYIGRLEDREIPEELVFLDLSKPS
jgi:transcription initiation factor TFIID TATA-box-binding protein